MTGPGAEMPFREHLEELRARLVRVVLALIAGFGVGLFVVQRLVQRHGGRIALGDTHPHGATFGAPFPKTT